MKCVICGQSNVDSAADESGEIVCVDCWASGEAAMEGRTAVCYCPPKSVVPVNYPPDMRRRFVEACNRAGNKEKDKHSQLPHSKEWGLKE